MYDQAIDNLDPKTYTLYLSDATLSAREGDLAPKRRRTMFKARGDDPVPTFDLAQHEASDYEDLVAAEKGPTEVSGIIKVGYYYAIYMHARVSQT